MATMLNVLDPAFGATYSGGVVTNLRAVIKNALIDTSSASAGLPVNARTLYLPRGAYQLEQGVSTMDSDLAGITSLRLVGDGAVISRAAGFTGRFFFFIQGIDASLSLDGAITFEGNTGRTSGAPPSGIPTNAARVAVMLAGGSPDQRARGLYVGPQVRFQNFWWRETSTSINIDHAVQAWYAREVEVHCQSKDVRGWTVWLETVDDFLVSDCRVDGCEWGGIQMRRAVRRGVVTGNQVRNAVSVANDFCVAIDMLGESDVDAAGPVLNERVLVANNWVSTNAAYGAGLRVKGCSHVDVTGNTVELVGAVPNVVRYGISVANKAYAGDATLHARGVCSDVRVAGNRVVSHVPAPSSGDNALLGGIYGLNEGAATTGSAPANRNIALVDNELVEDDGVFNGFGVRYGINGSNDGPTVGLIIRGNYGVASVAAAGVGLGAVTVNAHATDSTRGIQELTVERNTFRSRISSPSGSAGGTTGNISGTVINQYNVYQGYAP